MVLRTDTWGRDERGAMAVFFAVVSTVLFLVAAFVIDLGLARDERRQSQNAADASALAAGNALYPTNVYVPQFLTAIDKAKEYAAANFGVTNAEWAACTDPAKLAYVVPATTECISFDSLTKPSQVRVRIPDETNATAFGGVAGVQQITVKSSAVAKLNPAQMISCALCVLGTSDHYIGNGDLNVIGAGIHINGSLSGHQNANVTAVGYSITVEGSYAGPTYNPAATNAPQMGDPLAGRSLPPSWATLGNKSNPCSTGAAGGPGIYGSYSFPNSTCTLRPGMYVVTGTWSLKNNTKLRGTGVSLYFTCGTPASPRTCATSGEAGGLFDAKNGEVTISSMATGTLAGLIVTYDRNNTSLMTLQGNGLSVLTGTVYAKSALLDANGNSCHTIAGGSIVVKSIYLNGNTSCLRATNPLAQTWEVPPDGLHLDK